jgi:hypothetical protein
MLSSSTWAHGLAANGSGRPFYNPRLHCRCVPKHVQKVYGATGCAWSIARDPSPTWPRPITHVFIVSSRAAVCEFVSHFLMMMRVSVPTGDVADRV